MKNPYYSPGKDANNQSVMKDSNWFSGLYKGVDNGEGTEFVKRSVTPESLTALGTGIAGMGVAAMEANNRSAAPNTGMAGATGALKGFSMGMQTGNPLIGLGAAAVYGTVAAVNAQQEKEKFLRGRSRTQNLQRENERIYGEGDILSMKAKAFELYNS